MPTWPTYVRQGTLHDNWHHYLKYTDFLPGLDRNWYPHAHVLPPLATLAQERHLVHQFLLTGIPHRHSHSSSHPLGHPIPLWPRVLAVPELFHWQQRSTWQLLASVLVWDSWWHVWLPVHHFQTALRYFDCLHVLPILPGRKELGRSDRPELKWSEWLLWIRIRVHDRRQCPRW